MRVDIGDMTVAERMARIELLVGKVEARDFEVVEMIELQDLLTTVRAEYLQITEFAARMVAGLDDVIRPLLKELGLDKRMGL